jgi:hypothetical protein
MIIRWFLIAPSQKSLPATPLTAIPMGPHSILMLWYTIITLIGTRAIPEDPDNKVAEDTAPLQAMETTKAAEALAPPLEAMP